MQNFATLQLHFSASLGHRACCAPSVVHPRCRAPPRSFAASLRSLRSTCLRFAAVVRAFSPFQLLVAQEHSEKNNQRAHRWLILILRACRVLFFVRRAPLVHFSEAKRAAHLIPEMAERSGKEDAPWLLKLVNHMSQPTRRDPVEYFFTALVLIVLGVFVSLKIKYEKPQQEKAEAAQARVVETKKAK
eukprot:6610964-Prymnesium_polylepis.2